MREKMEMWRKRSREVRVSSLEMEIFGAGLEKQKFWRRVKEAEAQVQTGEAP